MMAFGKANELLEADRLDASHLFVEELRIIRRAIREVTLEEVTDGVFAENMSAADQITLELQTVARQRGSEQSERLRI